MSRRTPATNNPQNPERILNHLETLGVPLTEEQFTRVLREAEQHGWSHLELLDQLFGEQAAAKRERLIARRERSSGVVREASCKPCI